MKSSVLTRVALLGATVVLVGCQSAPAEEKLAKPDVVLAALERQQTDADVLPDALHLDDLNLDPASTRLLATHDGDSYWVGLAHDDSPDVDPLVRDLVCLVVERQVPPGSSAACGPMSTFAPHGVELTHFGHRVRLVPVEYEPGKGWQPVALNLYIQR